MHPSASKESTCNAGDPGSIPGSGRSSGEGIGYLLQYSGASLVDLPDPGIESGSPALQVDSLPTELSGKPQFMLNNTFL